RAIEEVRSPVYGAEADLEKVVSKMPWEVFGDDEKSAEEGRARQLEAVRRGVSARNRGGMALEKIILARAASKLGFDPTEATEENKKKSDPSDASSGSASTAAKNFAPPHLLGEGRKVQPLWLQSFLKNPVEIRPALRPLGEWANAGETSIDKAGGPHMPTY